MNAYLHVCDGVITDGKRPVQLRGVNFGGWLMMEGYIMGAPNIAVQVFKKEFARRLGKTALRDFEKGFYSTFIQRSDFARVKALGLNCIRLPFHYGLIESSPFKIEPAGVGYLDRALAWAGENGLKVILDMHAAPGAQNHDWHSDSLGTAGFWGSLRNQQRACAIWEYLADRYRDDTALVGYDLLNEAVVDDTKKLNAFYKRAIRAIRSVDRNHMIFVEGNRWAMDLEALDDFEDDNLVLSIHFYHPIEFSFNFIPELRYPLRSGSGVFDRTTLKRMIGKYAAFGRKKKRPILVGEFGINSRAGAWGDDLWLIDILDCFFQAGLHWTYWTFKAVKSHMFPDGIYSYFSNDPWVNRHGPRSGWETYADLWKTHRKKITRSWKTEEFKLNQGVAASLRTAGRRS